MRLPNKVRQNLGIVPEAEYDALVRMPPRRLAKIFYRLSVYKTKTVLISIIDNEGVGNVSFIKERDNGNVLLDRGSDSSSDEDHDRFSVRCSHSADHVQPEEAIIIEMEAEVDKLFCMMCLHKSINKITKDFPGATQVTMYMGTDVPTVIEYRVPEINFVGCRPPPANHRYHRKRERAEVMNEAYMDTSEDEEGDETDTEDGDEDEMDSEDDDEEEVEGAVVINRKRVWPEMMDDEVYMDGDEMDPQDEDGDREEDEMDPEDEDGDGEEDEDGDGEEDEMDPEDGGEEEMDAEDGVGNGEEMLRDDVNEVDAEQEHEAKRRRLN